ncbi:MAG: abortive infection protein [Thermoplasmata archaeon]
MGLEVWFSPALFDKSPAETLRYIIDAARVAESVRTSTDAKLVFCIGQELMLFMRGILPGRNLLERFNNPANRQMIRAGKHRAPLNAFLGEVTGAVRHVFHGPIAYASLPFEGVEWGSFDVVGVDHYWDERLGDRYLEMLHPFLATGKPVVVTGTGSRAYQGAHTTGTLGFGVVDCRSQFLHTLPLIGRLVRPHLKGTYIRDEGAPARRLTDVLGLLDGAGVEGVFIDSFVDPIAPFSDDPRYDLDMSALSLVKTYEHGHGSVYPDMTWDPKEAFHAVADFYANH